MVTGTSPERIQFQTDERSDWVTLSDFSRTNEDVTITFPSMYLSKEIGVHTIGMRVSNVNEASVPVTI
jgi:hypothetical protein